MLDKLRNLFKKKSPYKCNQCMDGGRYSVSRVIAYVYRYANGSKIVSFAEHYVDEFTETYECLKKCEAWERR